jgi:hypothetical protein
MGTVERRAWATQEHAETMRCESERRADETLDPAIRARFLSIARLYDKIAESTRKFRTARGCP